VDLTPEQIRVLGSLVEKEATTPDVYPLSTNALQTACNQRSSRDPVVDYDEGVVIDTMLALRERGLARTNRGAGSRVYKHSHALPEVLGIDDAELAVLSVLMLRGPQTPGELRTRTERQHTFASVEDVDAALRRLADREPPLATQLSRQPGQKESRWIHRLGADESPEFAPPAAPVRPAVEAPPRDDVAALRAELAELRDRIEALEARLPDS
jgi:uncharacterized protein YceH (UPF0502 family)